MAIEYRACEPADIPAILALWQRAGAVPRPTDHEAALLLRLARDRELFVLAVEDGRIVGSLIAGWDGWRGNMYRLVVDFEYRRLGVARRLVETAESRLRSLGAERITSLVFFEEPGASEFWAGLGYEIDPAVMRYAKDVARDA
jgi:ribosomal protein S18 acetylase RimI-like enzyme